MRKPRALALFCLGATTTTTSTTSVSGFQALVTRIITSPRPRGRGNGSGSSGVHRGSRRYLAKRRAPGLRHAAPAGGEDNNYVSARAKKWVQRFGLLPHVLCQGQSSCSVPLRARRARKNATSEGFPLSRGYTLSRTLTVHALVWKGGQHPVDGLGVILSALTFPCVGCWCLLPGVYCERVVRDSSYFPAHSTAVVDAICHQYQPVRHRSISVRLRRRSVCRCREYRTPPTARMRGDRQTMGPWVLRIYS